jgi:hypothetical protein
MQIDVVLSNGLAGCTIRDTIDVDDDYTDEQIEAEVREWALERAEWSWEKSGG